MGAAGVVGGGLVMARLFGRGQVHEGNKHPLPTEDGVICDSFKNAQGLSIRTYEYPQTRDNGQPEAVAVFVHGIGSHAHWEFTAFPGNTYTGGWIDAFNRRGIAVHLLDLQGHGRSDAYEGMMNHVNEFDDYGRDVIQLVKQLKMRYNHGTKFFITGESMGGCVVASVGELLGDSIDGIILLAPMLSLEQVKAKPINKVLLPFVSVLACVVPLLPIGAKAKNTFFPDIYEAYQLDPLTYCGKVRTSMSKECLGAVDRAMECAAQLTAPCLIFHSKIDTMTDPQGSAAFFEKLQQKDKTFTLLENGMWHALCKEPGQEELGQTAIDWVLARC